MEQQNFGFERCLPRETDIQFAVFNGNEEITEQMYEEVERFAAYVAEYQKNKDVSK